MIESASAETPAALKVKAPDKLTRVVDGVTYVKVKGGWKKAQ
jgi:hypothetical protein